MSDEGAFIRWVNVWKSFGANRVLRGVNLEVRRGETLGVIGRSGEGKSVLLKTLVGLLRPEDGEIWVNGEEILRDRRTLDRARSLLGMVFQNSALFDSLTVAENLALPYWENTDATLDVIKKRISTLLGLVGMSGVEELMPSELSGGMRKRVGLARALADEPKVVLYDEPTTGLDPIMSDTINDLILRMQRELQVTSIVVTHDLASVRKVADRIAMLHAGRIIYIGTTEAFFSSEDPYVRQFIEGSAEGPIRVAQFAPTPGMLDDGE